MSLFPKPFTIIRTTKHLGPLGVWIKDSTQTLTFSGSVQPLSGYDLSVLDTGSQEKGQLWVYTSDTLIPRQEGDQTSGDILQYDGHSWEIMPPKVCDQGILSHKQYRAQLRPDVPVA